MKNEKSAQILERKVDVGPISHNMKKIVNLLFQLLFLFPTILQNFLSFFHVFSHLFLFPYLFFLYKNKQNYTMIK